MKAALFAGVGNDLRVEDVTALPPGPDEVVVEIGASGVCHTDLSVTQGYLPMPDGTVLGHEAAGRVVETGDRVTAVRPGDRVVAAFSPACGTCWYCVNQATHLCELSGAVNVAPRVRRADGSTCIGFTGLGTFTERMTVHQASVVAVESELPDEQLALLGCGVTTGLGAALNTAAVVPGSSVAVLGCGGVGQAVVQGARIAGAERIIAIEPVAFKRELALASGATDAIDPGDGDVRDRVRALTGGRGADYVFDAVGRAETITQGFDLARRGGAIVAIGMPPRRTMVELSAFRLFFDEKRLLGSYYGSAQIRRDLPRYARLAESGRLDLESLVSRRITLDEVNDALAAIESGSVLRSVIVP